MPYAPWWRLFFVLLFWGIPAALSGQPRSSVLPIQATPCQLEAHPDVYDGKLVEVRGHIYFGKFDFIIDSDCKQHRQPGVWLDLGGDIRSPGDYWGVVSFLPKQKGQDIQVRGIPIPVVRDALLDRFVNDVGATRFRKPNGDGCGSECLFYEVTATLRGRFFSGTKGGFGMERCCHLLRHRKGPTCFVQAYRSACGRRVPMHVRSLATFPGGIESPFGNPGMFAAGRFQQLLGRLRETLGRHHQCERKARLSGWMDVA